MKEKSGTGHREIEDDFRPMPVMKEKSGIKHREKKEELQSMPTGKKQVRR